MRDQTAPSSRTPTAPTEAIETASCSFGEATSATEFHGTSGAEWVLWRALRSRRPELFSDECAVA